MLLEISAPVRSETRALAQSASLGLPLPGVVASRTAQAASIQADMKTCDIAASASCGPIATINFFVARRTEG